MQLKWVLNHIDLLKTSPFLYISWKKHLSSSLSESLSLLKQFYILELIGKLESRRFSYLEFVVSNINLELEGTPLVNINKEAHIFVFAFENNHLQQMFIKFIQIYMSVEEWDCNTQIDNRKYFQAEKFTK